LAACVLIYEDFLSPQVFGIMALLLLLFLLL